MENENASTLETPPSAEEPPIRKYVHIAGRVQIELDETDPSKKTMKFTFLDAAFEPILGRELFFYLDKPIKFIGVHLVGEFIQGGFNSSRKTLIDAGLILPNQTFADLEDSNNVAGMNPSGKPPPPPRSTIIS